jgi:hypothetical protein
MAASERDEARPPLGIAVDGDLGSRLDAVLAVAMLNGFAAKGEARRISLSVSSPSLSAARLADVIAEFYPTLPTGAGFLTIGLADVKAPRFGVSDRAAPSEGASGLAAMLSQTAADGTPLYPTRIGSILDTAENCILLRNMLLAEHDGNAAIVLAGPATGLARLLDMHGARSQIVAKVRYLVVAAGSFAGGAPDRAIQRDVAAARRLFAEWPTPLVAVGSEVGEALRYPASSIENDLAWSPAHPIAAAYRALAAMPHDASTTALAAVLHAVQPGEGHFKLSEPGVIRVLDDGQTRFMAAKDGPHRHLILDPAQRGRLVALYTSLVSAMPAPRPVRRRREMQVTPMQPAPAAGSDAKVP